MFSVVGQDRILGYWFPIPPTVVAQVSYLARGCFQLLARIESWATQLVPNFANGCSPSFLLGERVFSVVGQDRILGYTTGSQFRQQYLSVQHLMKGRNEVSRSNHLFTSESVTEGHPDKIADQISDAILDDIMGEDPKGRVACETMVTTGLAFVAGEITTSWYVDIPKIVRETIRGIGYTDATYGFDYETCAVITSIDEQSPDIAMGVDREGAGDQGMMFGYACRETAELMPMPILLAHKLARRLAYARKQGILKFLRPDGKSQVTVEYVDEKPVRVHTVVIAAQHDPAVEQKELEEGILEEVIKATIPADLLTEDTIYHIIPASLAEK